MKTRKRPAIRTLLMAGALLLAAGHGALADESEDRVSVTTQGPASDMDSGAVLPASRDEFGALLASGKRERTQGLAVQHKATKGSASAINVEFWFYDVWVELYSDVDRDGFYTGIELTFDADTIYSSAEVFAVVYLSYEYGPWNEYAETDIFTILGTSALDEYTIETDLVSGYPPGSYDILIELYDAFDGALVAAIGPDEKAELTILPLEDIGYDSLGGDTTQVVINSGGGGSAGLTLLIALAGAAVFSRRRGTSPRQAPPALLRHRGPSA